MLKLIKRKPKKISKEAKLADDVCSIIRKNKKKLRDCNHLNVFIEVLEVIQESLK